MTRYQALISKIQELKEGKKVSLTIKSDWDLTPSELELIENALETLQVLEIILRLGLEKSENHG